MVEELELKLLYRVCKFVIIVDHILKILLSI